jgi:hypothetical protein
MVTFRDKAPSRGRTAGVDGKGCLVKPCGDIRLEGSRCLRWVPNHISVIPLPEVARAWEHLQAGVPITLLCDLLYPDGPPSREFYLAECLVEDVARSHPAGPSTGSEKPSMPGA